MIQSRSEIRPHLNTFQPTRLFGVENSNSQHFFLSHCVDNCKLHNFQVYSAALVIFPLSFHCFSARVGLELMITEFHRKIRFALTIHPRMITLQHTTAIESAFDVHEFHHRRRGKKVVFQVPPLGFIESLKCL